MISALILALAAGEAHFVESRVPVEGEILDRRFADVDGDGREEIILAVLGRDPRRRELHVHGVDADGKVAVSPSRTVPVMDDVTVYGFGEVRPDPGLELLFLTRTGVWSYSTSGAGYRDNIARVVQAELLFDVPDPRDLPCWRYVLGHEGGCEILLPEPDSFSIWGPAQGDPAAPWQLRARFDDETAGLAFSAEAAATVSYNGRRLTVERSDDPIIELQREMLAPLLSTGTDRRAPALLDVDGDGRTDLLLRHHAAIEIHLDQGAGIPAEATRVEPMPDYLGQQSADLSLDLVDLDGDADQDVLARVTPERESLDPVVSTFFVLLNDGRRLFPEKPDQLLRFEASEVRADLFDVDGDGRQDLFITKFEMPSAAEIATGFQFRRSTFLYLGEADSPFGRKPVLRDEATFDIDSLQDAIVLRQLTRDVSGDGVADLVEKDLSGRLAVRRLLPTRGLFGGGGWELEAEPWRQFETGGDVRNLIVQDISGDGVADIITGTNSVLVTLISVRSGP